MEILITGGAGFLGVKLARQLLARGTLSDATGTQRTINRITLLDRVAAQGFEDPRIVIRCGDVSDAATIDSVMTADVASIFHLAAVVSGEAENDFDLGMRINLDATRLLLDAARHKGHCPRFIFTSSLAVFGGALPQQVLDTTALTPQGSYGAQKAMGELMVTDYSRKGYIDGRALRVPTVSVRPGLPNKAASGFASGIIREPLNGMPVVCPVAPDTRVWLCSPRSALINLIHSHEIDGQSLGASRSLSLPGLATTVGEMVSALGRIAGKKAVDLISWQEDAAVSRLIRSWPGDFLTTRADALGFIKDADFDAVIEAYVADELGGLPDWTR
jgi:nucleoside-diphosphate-sugar epimerase